MIIAIKHQANDEKFLPPMHLLNNSECQSHPLKGIQ